jgi:biotin carboxylase
VLVCENEDDLAKAGYATLSQFTSHGRRQGDAPVTVERFVKGPIAQYVSVAWEGRVVAGASAVKLRSNPDKTGPATVIQFVDPGEAEELVGVLAAHTRFTGFATHDYIVEEATGQTYLIECNPRPMAASAAAIHAGVNLGEALFAAVTGAPRQRFLLSEGTVVALYPQEIIRDPASEFIETAIHDVPENDPDLRAAYEAYVEQKRSPGLDSC